MKTIQEIISEYTKNLNSLKNNKMTPFEIVINEEWNKIDNNIEIIYCGDNPGITEKNKKKYFVGAAGIALNLFIKVNNKRLGINNGNYAFFNKTPCFSNKTKQITKSKDSNKVVYDSIGLTIDCLFEISQIKKIPIIIFGIDESSYIVKTFKEKLLSNKKYCDFKNNLTFLNHPSHNSLFAVFGEFLISNFKDNDEIEIKYSDLIDKTKKNWQ